MGAGGGVGAAAGGHEANATGGGAVWGPAGAGPGVVRVVQRERDAGGRAGVAGRGGVAPVETAS
jgi:hypothetical protein